MKRIVKPFIIVILIMALLQSVQMSAIADIGNSLVGDPYQYIRCDVSGAGSFLYRDAMLFGDAHDFSTDLAKASVVLAQSAYDKYQIYSALLQIDVTFQDPIGYDRLPSQYSLGDCHYVAYTLAYKRCWMNGEEYIIYYLPIRGTPENLEWVSDFTIGDGDDHEGFFTAAEPILERLRAIIPNDSYDADHTKLWITGHSRGAAVSNIVAREMSDWTELNPDNIFCYAFACPRVSKNANSHGYTNINNFVISGDLIPMLPLEDWDFDRNGQTIVLPSPEHAAPDTTAYHGLLIQIFPNEDSIHTPWGQLALLLLSNGLAQGGKVSCGTVIQYWLSQNADEITFKLAMGNGFTLSALIESLGRIGNAANYWKVNLEMLKALGPADLEKWIERHSDEIAELAELVVEYEIPFINADNLVEAAEIVAEMASGTSTLNLIRGVAEKVKDLLLDDAEQVKDAIYYGHWGHSYIKQTNARYFGEGGAKDWDCSEPVVLSSPEGPITSIGPSCFEGKSQLSSVSGGCIQAVGKNAFSGCTGLTGELELYQSLLFIDEGAFSGCTGLTGVPAFTDGLMRIERDAFNGCSGLEELDIPDSTTYIGTSAFQDCTSIRRIKLPITTKYAHSTYEYPGGPTFKNCSAVEELEFTYKSGEVFDPGYITSIGYCFACSSLKRVILQDTIPSLPISMFQNCRLLESVRTDLSSEDTVFELPSELIEIPGSLFSNCQALCANGVRIPDKVTSIGYNAFYNCHSLSGTLFVPESTTSIIHGAFMNCSGLTALEIGNNVNEIGFHAFDSCSGVKRLKLPVSARYRDDNGLSAFSNDIHLEELEYTAGNGNVFEPLGSYEMNALSGMMRDTLSRVILADDLTALPTHAFYYCTKLSSVRTSMSTENETFDLPSQLLIIPDKVFGYCQALTGDIDIPSGVTTIGEDAFYGCENLSGELILPTGLNCLGGGAFSGCRTLTGSAIIPNGVPCIGDSTFNNCRGLTGSIVIPDTVTEIGVCAFMNCEGLTGDLIIPSSVTAVGDYAFQDCRSLAGAFVISEGVTSIGSYAFDGCSGLTGGLTIPDTVLSIGESAFSSCSGLDGSIKLSKNLTEIADYTFSRCSSLTGSLVIEDGVTRIGKEAFWYCSEMTGTLTLPDGLISIGKCAFEGCCFTSTLDLPNSLTSIGECAFEYCSGFLGAVVIPSGVTSVDRYTFWGCDGITEVSIMSENLISIGAEAFNNCRALKDVTIFSGNCLIDDTAYTIPQSITIHGLNGSTAWAYAEKYGNPFVSLCHMCCASVTLTMGDAVRPILINGLTEIDQLIYSSDNPGVVRANDNGVSAVGFGIATVTATSKSDNTVAADMVITVANQKALVLPASLTEINDSAFANATTERVEVSANVSIIGLDAFKGILALETIVMYGDTVTFEGNPFSESGNPVILCHRNSTVEAFAKENSFPYMYLID